MTYMPREQRKMKDLEEHINHQEDKHLEMETGLGTILGIVLEIHKMMIEVYQEDPEGLEVNLERFQVIDQMIEKGMIEMILNRNPTNIVNIVVKMVIRGNIVGRCKPMQRKQEGLRR